MTSLLNAHQATARLDKITNEIKTEIVISDGRFVTIFKPKAAHVLFSKVEGDTDMNNLIRLLIHVVRIDNEIPKVEDILDLYLPDFNLIIDQVSK